jgi:SAM-dependent methyltransferase
MERSPKYDLELFERLQHEYRNRPVLKPGPRDPAQLQGKARRHLELITEALGLSHGFEGASVLELGTGRGWLARTIATEGGAARVVGVDVGSAAEWGDGDDPRLTFAVGDIADGELVPFRSIDYVVSTAVFEHVERPLETLRALFRILRPGGQAWLRFNLYASAVASHRYDQVNFPWPHLLFEDHVLAQYFEAHEIRDPMRGTAREHRFAWVNTMTVAHYLQVCAEIGFEIVSLNRRVRRIDVEFYRRFEDKLGRYPALDLETDFATLVLRRPRQRRGLRGLLRRSRRAGGTVAAGYLERQRKLRRRLITREDAPRGS